LLGGGTKEVVPFVILVIIIMIRPYGIFGKETIERV
jgi:branched-chain amino acid transport system permease protein